MTDATDDVVDGLAAVGKALGGSEKSAPVEERYPEAPADVLETIEYVEERLESIEQRLAEKERKKQQRAEFVADLVEKIEDVEAKVSTVERRYGVNQ